MHDHRETDIAHRLRNATTDAQPLPRRAIESVDSTVVLLIEAIGITRTQAHAVWIVEGHGRAIEAFDDLHAVNQHRKRPAAIERFMHAAARHRKIEMLRVAWINDDRMQLRPIRGPIFLRPHPFAILRVVVDARERRPGLAAVLRAKQSLR